MKVKVPPIKTQGIKTKLVPWIKEMVCWDGRGRWLEPFMGSGVVGFNILPQRALFCDTNPHLIKVYQAIKDKQITPAIARSFLEEEGHHLSQRGADYYYAVRDRFNNRQAPLDFIFLNRSCFNGMIRFNQKGQFNVPFGHKPLRFAPAYITKIVNQILYVSEAIEDHDWQFQHQDFETTIAEATQADFIYCDPPYMGRYVDYYNGWDEAQEHRLCQLLKHSPAKFMLSTWHSNQYRTNVALETLWAKFQVQTREHFYHVGAREKNRHPMREALVFNY